MPGDFRVIVTGARDWHPSDLAVRVVGSLKARHGDSLLIVHGNAPGVDQCFEMAARALKVRTEPHPARWDAEGKGAGPRRNQRMVDAGAALCLAFHPDLSKALGTGDCVRRCLAAGIPVWHTATDDPATPPMRVRAWPPGRGE